MKYDLRYVRPSGLKDLTEKTNTDYFCEKELGYSVYHNAYVVPVNFNTHVYQRGALSSKGEVIQGSLLFEGFYSDWGKDLNLENAQYKSDIAIYLGWLEPVWGHVLTDDLKKFWFLKTDECKRLLSEGAKLIVLIPWPSKSLEEILCLADVPIESIENITELTQYKTVYIPDNSIIIKGDGKRYYTKEYKTIVNIIVEKIPLAKNDDNFPEKVYFTRSAFSSAKFWERREHGEKSIENVFREQGYEIISPEKYSVLETLTMLRNCKAFAATEGSISHNALFCRPNTEVTIVRKVNWTNTWQLIINQVADINVTYVDAHQSIISSGCAGPFYLCITKELERLVGHRILHIPHLFRPSFWWYLIQNRRITKTFLNYLK